MLQGACEGCVGALSVLGFWSRCGLGILGWPTAKFKGFGRRCGAEFCFDDSGGLK